MARPLDLTTFIKHAVQSANNPSDQRPVEQPKPEAAPKHQPKPAKQKDKVVHEEAQYPWDNLPQSNSCTAFGDTAPKVSRAPATVQRDFDFAMDALSQDANFNKMLGKDGDGVRAAVRNCIESGITDANYILRLLDAASAGFENGEEKIIKSMDDGFLTKQLKKDEFFRAAVRLCAASGIEDPLEIADFYANPDNRASIEKEVKYGGRFGGLKKALDSCSGTNFCGQARTTDILETLVGSPKLSEHPSAVAAFLDTARKAGASDESAKRLLQDICEHSPVGDNSAIETVKKLNDALNKLKENNSPQRTEKFLEMCDAIITASKMAGASADAFQHVEEYLDKGYELKTVKEMYSKALSVEGQESFYPKLVPAFLGAGIEPRHFYQLSANGSIEDESARYTKSIEALEQFKLLLALQYPKKLSVDECADIVGALFEFEVNPNFEGLKDTVISLLQSGLDPKEIKKGICFRGQNKEFIVAETKLMRLYPDKEGHGKITDIIRNAPDELLEYVVTQSYNICDSMISLGESPEMALKVLQASMNPLVLKHVDTLLYTMKTKPVMKKDMLDTLHKVGPQKFAQFCAFIYNTGTSHKTVPQLLTMCEDVEKKFDLHNWSAYSEKIFDYLLNPQSYNCSYDIKIVEYRRESDLMSAIKALPDHSQPRIELAGHGKPKGVAGTKTELGLSEKLFLLAPIKEAEGLTDDQIIDQLFSESEDSDAIERREFLEGYIADWQQDVDSIDVGDSELSQMKPKFTDAPPGKEYQGKRPLLFSITTADHNGAFNSTYSTLEQFIDFSGDTSIQPPGSQSPYKGEVVLDSCSTGSGDGSIAEKLREWFGVPVTAPTQDVGSTYVVENGRMEIKYVWSQNPAANVKRVIN